MVKKFSDRKAVEAYFRANYRDLRNIKFNEKTGIQLAITKPKAIREEFPDEKKDYTQFYSFERCGGIEKAYNLLISKRDQVKAIYTISFPNQVGHYIRPKTGSASSKTFYHEFEVQKRVKGIGYDRVFGGGNIETTHANDVFRVFRVAQLYKNYLDWCIETRETPLKSIFDSSKSKKMYKNKLTDIIKLHDYYTRKENLKMRLSV